jgi:hypothetical protein
VSVLIAGLLTPTTTKNLILIKPADEIRSMSTEEPGALDLERRSEADELAALLAGCSRA